MSAISTADIHTINNLLEQHKTLPGALLPILHSIQDQLGYVPPEVVPMIASTLNQSSAEIHGVISFYHHFLTHKPGQNKISICLAESCQALGSTGLEKDIKQRLNIDYHQTTKDGKYTLEPVYCLGNCACSPAIRIGEKIYGEMDINKFDELLEALVTYKVELT
ncbi:formate dehydrogenase subunit gamma [Paraglaciecola sp. MB-3u-78]|jgi:formate dehydrogenase subunit gamma|uniref:formate dehydrogenase subunit gamma n=1 Tax=Paraglaciecola sp. MB-3u-78 TaxID=2058332 RepID=UPI000C340017|nr:formate dehydrogenase subunit gamma [Paraglaciecola sp. MB-3u-78]PKG98879.1 formate dehydrogenase subunit gamma [Paraglaciecola sp. MB-3u-78]